MTQLTFKTPVIKVESLETKFDLSVVSNSLVALLEDYLEARVLQQLHYWLQQGYGVVIDGIRWIYKPLHEWLSEAILGFSTWQLRKAIASLLEKELIRQEKKFTQHQMQQGARFWWQPKNQTYYYSLNYDRLRRLMEETEKASNDEDNRVVSDTKLSDVNFENTKCCENYSFYTKNTSIKNNSKDQSLPTLPSECNNSNSVNQEKGSFNSSNLSSNSKKAKDSDGKREVIAKETSSAHVESNINQDRCPVTDELQKEVPQPKIQKAIADPKQKRKKQAPWKDEEEFKRFYRALVQALPIVANSHSPQGLAQTIIKQLRCGIPHTYWDDFAAGLPIGSSTKPEWEISPGEPYPMFVEYLTEKIKRGDNSTSDEQTRNEVFRILNQPKIAKAFWGQFKRSVVNVSQQVERDRALGVTNPHTPVWTRERVEPTIEEAKIAGEKIMTINGSDRETARFQRDRACLAAVRTPQLESKQPLPEKTELDRQSPDRGEEISDPWAERTSSENKFEGQTLSNEEKSLEPDKLSLRELLTQKLGNRNLKGFVKAMPKVSESEVEVEKRQAMQPKTNISSMSITEINDYLSDSILRKQIMPQLWHSSYQLIMDELGEIIAVKPPSTWE